MSKAIDGEAIQAFFDKCEDRVVLAAAGKNDKGDFGFRVEWSVEGVGFGEFQFFTDNGVLTIDNEAMSREFIKKVLGMMVDSAKLMWEEP